MINNKIFKIILFQMIKKILRVREKIKKSHELLEEIIHNLFLDRVIHQMFSMSQLGR